MGKKLLLIGKDSDGDVTTHKVTSLKELFELKKKYDSSEVIEVDNDDGSGARVGPRNSFCSFWNLNWFFVNYSFVLLMKKLYFRYY